MEDRAGRNLSVLAARRRQEFVAQHRWALLIVTMVVVGFVALVGLLALVYSSPLQRGLMWGALGVSVPWFLFIVIQQESGAAIAELGVSGEIKTAGALRRLERHGWQVVNDIAFAEWNVDHVAVGPGGVLAVETKFTTCRWDPTARRLHPALGAAVHQASAGAARIQAMLREVGELPVMPVLMCWGPDLVHVPGGCVERDGVFVIVGRQADEAITRWASSESLDSVTVDCAVHRLEMFVADRDRYEAGRAAR